MSVLPVFAYATKYGFPAFGEISNASKLLSGTLGHHDNYSAGYAVSAPFRAFPI